MSSWKISWVTSSSLIPGHRVPNIAPGGGSFPPGGGGELGHPGEAGAGAERGVEGRRARGGGAVRARRVEARVDRAWSDAARAEAAREARRVRVGGVLRPRVDHRDVHRGRGRHDVLSLTISTGLLANSLGGFHFWRLLPRLWLPSAPLTLLDQQQLRSRRLVERET